MLGDSYGRQMTYLRLSVTDRCGLSCRYCMPRGEPAGNSCLGRILTYEELVRITKILACLGIRKIRLTGGEPLSRCGISKLIAMLRKIDGIDQIAMTTNGIGMKAHAADLARQGLSSVNIHIDSLRPLTYRWITGRESMGDALDGIDATMAAGFDEVKLNAVLMRGINDSEVEDLIAFAVRLRVPIRFIELMPMADEAFHKKHFIGTGEIIDRLGAKYTLVPIQRHGLLGPASYQRIEETGAVVGFIGHRSDKFCDSCNRLRLLADGTLKACIASNSNLSLGSLMHLGDDELAKVIRRYAMMKANDHANFKRELLGTHSQMNTIGG